MRSKKYKRIGAGLGLLLFAWVLMAQSCMKFRISDADAIKQFSAQGVTLHIHNLSVNHRILHYVETGNDSLPTIVFVHGSPGSWDAFAQYLRDKDLLSKYRMVSIDRPGFGYSNFGEALPMGEQSAIISPLFQVLQNHRAVYLVGHSLGGPLVVQLAVDNPGLISGLVILAGSLDISLEEPERWRTLLMNNPLQYLVPGAMRPSNQELWYLKKDLRLLRPRFALVTCPVWVVHGDKDQLVPYGNMHFAVKAFTHAASVDTLTLTGANHFIPWTHYKQVKSVLMELDNDRHNGKKPNFDVAKGSTL
ncbi:MAG TPA: alpha/beta hydrolase [Sediminibacterium sp.]|nr:alpha/beta hydrolase [Sediminibacterium sp.]